MSTIMNGYGEAHGQRGWEIEDVEPWPEAVEGKELLNELEAVMRRHVVLPPWAAETAALWVPEELNDRAADVWEPLFVLAEIAGGAWPDKAGAASIGLTD